MLTPTGVTYAQYWDAIKAGNPTHVRFTFLGQNIVLEDEDVLLSSGVNLTDMFNGDTDLVFGRTLSKQITVTFINSNRLNGLQWTGEFTLEFGVEINGTTNWVTIGYFSGEKPNNVTSAQTIQFTAYDRMGLFDVLADEFVKSLTYPKTVAQIYNALCTYVGLQKVSGDELANIMSRSFSSAPAEMKGYTCRDILSWIAEACGCYAKITSAGKVKMVWFTDNTAHAVTGTEEFRVESGDIHDGMTWDEADTYTWNEFDNFTWDDVCGYKEALRVNRLYVKQLSSDMDINYPNVYGDNVYAIVENPFLSISTASDITNYLVPIYNRLYNFGGYLPVQLECVGNWCVEAGDIITIDVNSMTITFPVFVKTMRWSGAINDSYETTASGKRQIYNSESTKQRVLSSNKIEMYVTEAESEMQTYTDGQVSGAKSYADGKVTDALNTVDQNYYKIRSGISITVDGVTISGSKYINIESGSKIDIKNGADLDIESGGDINIKSGGKASVASGGNLDDSGSINVKSGGKIDVASGGDVDVNSGGDINLKSGGKLNLASGSDIEVASGGDINIASGGNIENSGNINIKSGGKVDVKSGGDIDVQSGGDINVKSGGNFNIASGGHMNVNASGTLALTGATVSITSGSTFDVSATNFEINSTGKYLKAGNWTFNDNGAKYSSGSNDYFISNNYSGVITNNTRGGLFFDTDANGGDVSLYVKKTSGIVAGRLHFTTSPGDITYLYSVSTNSSSKKTVLGTDAHWFSSSYLSCIVGQKYYGSGNVYAGRGLTLDFSQNYDPEQFLLSSDRFLQFTGDWSDSTKSIEVFCSGNIKFLSTIDAGTIKYSTLTQKSSREIKHDIKPLQPIGKKLDTLKPVTFVYDDDKNEQQRMGLIYEDTVETMPEICTGDESDKAINYVELIPALLKEIQELRIRVKALEEREVN